MRSLAGYFLRGLLITAPVVVTIYICWLLVTTIDGWLGIDYPGVGILVAVVGITLVGVLASNLVTRSVLGWVEQALERLPFVRFLYTATKDLLNAFVGEHRQAGFEEGGERLRVRLPEVHLVETAIRPGQARQVLEPGPIRERDESPHGLEAYRPLAGASRGGRPSPLTACTAPLTFPTQTSALHDAPGRASPKRDSTPTSEGVAAWIRTT